MFNSFKTKTDDDVRSQDSTTSCNKVTNKPSFNSKSDRKEENQLSAKTASLMNNPSLIKEQIQEKYRSVLI